MTPDAAALLRQLTAQHGPLMFHQSGGCCDGSAPMCYPVGMFLTGPSDVLLGTIDAGLDDPIEVYMSASQFEYWKYTHLTIDVVPGRGAGFSVEGPTGLRFLIRSRMLDAAERLVGVCSGGQQQRERARRTAGARGGGGRRDGSLRPHGGR